MIELFCDLMDLYGATYNIVYLIHEGSLNGAQKKLLKRKKEKQKRE